MDNSIAFSELRELLENAGYALLKTQADRRIFFRRGWPLINVPVKDKRVRKTYYNRIKELLKKWGLI